MTWILARHLHIYLLSFLRFWTLSIQQCLFWMTWHWKPAVEDSFPGSILVFVLLPSSVRSHRFSKISKWTNSIHLTNARFFRLTAENNQKLSLRMQIKLKHQWLNCQIIMGRREVGKEGVNEWICEWTLLKSVIHQTGVSLKNQHCNSPND